jgi:pimeloyl-ACP methyl ester carboxylesterase
MSPDKRRVPCDGITLSVEDTGDGAPVVLLHGFPNSSAMWRPLAARLVEAGCRVVAPDLRGYGESDAPVGKENYRLSRIAEDVIVVMDTLGITDRAHLVGHDWGAGVGWLLAGSRPDRFRSYAALSLGHPYAYRRGGLGQLLKAWYVFLFLCPGVAERAVSAGDWALFRRSIKHPDVDDWIADLARPGRLTAGLNWYRKNALNPGPVPKAEIPVLGVWSSDDIALNEKQMTLSSHFVKSSWRYERFDDIGHWVPLDAPERLADLLLEFFAEVNG